MVELESESFSELTHFPLLERRNHGNQQLCDVSLSLQGHYSHCCFTSAASHLSKVITAVSTKLPVPLLGT